MRRLILLLIVTLSTSGIWAQTGSQGTSESVRELVLQARGLAGEGQHHEAARVLARALALAPNSEEALRDYAQNSLAVADPVGAMGALEPLTRIHPKVAEYSYLLGVAQIQVAAVSQAVQSLEMSLALDPNRPKTMIALGLAYNTQRRYDLAQEVLARSLLIAPEEVEGLAAMAEAEEGLGNLDMAEYYAQRVLVAEGTHHAASYVLGKVRMSQGRFEEARDQFQQVVAISPDSPKAHYQLSLAYARLNDLENSKKHRELYIQAKDKEDQHIIDMRTRAGMGVGGMKL